MMKTLKKILILSLVLMINMAQAAYLQNVKIIESNESNDGMTVKLKTEKSPEGSYFYLKLSKNDTNYKTKSEIIKNKFQNPTKFKLNLSIISFSEYPSGSSYNGNDVLISIDN